MALHMELHGIDMEITSDILHGKYMGNTGAKKCFGHETSLM